jgi:hypothetical protein
MAGFSELATSLCAPILGILIVKKPIVSSRHLKNSRFWETAVGDRVRSALRDRAYSANSRIPPHDRRQIRCAARHVAGMPPWWSSRLVSMLRLFQRDGPFIRANASFARSRLDFRTAILSFRMSLRSVTPCSTNGVETLMRPFRSRSS